MEKEDNKVIGPTEEEITEVNQNGSKPEKRKNPLLKKFGRFVLPFLFGLGGGVSSPSAESSPPVIEESHALEQNAQFLGTKGISLEGSTATVAKAVELAPKIPEQTIDKVETYGADKALTQKELEDLYKQLNKKELKVEDDIYYNTTFVKESVYKSFESKKYKENFQEFITKHFNYLNKILEDGGKKYEVNAPKVELRRLIVIKDDTQTADVYSLQEDLTDSDGGWLFETGYDPTKAGWYDETLDVDIGLIHELGHSTLHLPDNYSLDTVEQPDQPVLPTLPKKWRTYMATNRNDTKNDLMYAGQKIGESTLLLVYYLVHLAPGENLVS